MKSVFYFFLIFSIWSLPSWGKRYYCHNKPGVVSAFDMIVQVEQLKGQAIVYTNYFGGEKNPVDSYKIDDVILSVYSDSCCGKSGRFLLFKMDLSQNIFYYGWGSHESISSFEKSYQEPYSKQNLS